MASFDVYKDSPNAIKNEGQQISIKFERTSPTTGRISWNIPDPLNGCAVGDQAYDGIIVTLDTTHTNIKKSPVNGELYTADTTADRDIHAGDRIDTSLVVGAFYNDKETTFLDVTDIDENTPYYVSGFAADKVHRYHTQGVHSYSLNLESDFGTDDTAGCQDIRITAEAIVLTDPTNLLLATPYTFDIALNDPEMDNDNRALSTYAPIFNEDIANTITIDGTNAQTYQELLDEINKQFKLIDNPFQAVSPPNTNGYYWDGSNVFEWDGYQNVLQDAIIELTDPTVNVLGDLWFDTTLLNRWDGAVWQPTPYLSFYKDFTSLDCGDYWYNGTNVYNWSGDVWCTTTEFHSDTSPSLPAVLDCGSYWYNTDSSVLSVLKDSGSVLNLLGNGQVWTPTNAVYWGVAPNALAVNTYWYNDNLLELNQWNGTTFDPLAVITSSTVPTTPANGDFWFNPDTSVLSEYDALVTTWTPLSVVVFPEDPTNVESCDLWWNSTNDQLSIWNVITLTWDLVSVFIQDSEDPLAVPEIEVGTIWRTVTNPITYKWDGVNWIDISINVINWATDPTIRILDDVWFSTLDKTWNVWNGTVWVITDIIESLIDPSAAAITPNTLWFDTTNNTLQMWNGLAWILLAYSSTSLAPINDTLWYDTANDILYIWGKNTWNVATPIVSAEIINTGFRFCSALLGHESNVLVDQQNANLFSEIVTIIGVPGALSYTHFEGTDGAIAQPLYAQLGVGTDGSPDERRELITSIKYQLGYPAVEVELTPQQYDYCVDGAIEELRKRSSAAYKRGFFFIDLKSDVQRYLLTNNGNGFNKIVRVMGMYRTTSAFIGALYDNAQFGQVAINHLYNMGSYDLISFHIVADYIEQLEMLFATRVLFQFNESTRALDILQSVHKPERMLMDVSVERTEQDMIQDRQLKPWIENYALAQAMLILAQIRGKYASLPGANGVSLNAQDLTQGAIEIIDRLMMEIDDYVIETPEEFGMESTLLIG